MGRISKPTPLEVFFDSPQEGKTDFVGSGAGKEAAKAVPLNPRAFPIKRIKPRTKTSSGSNSQLPFSIASI